MSQVKTIDRDLDLVAVAVSSTVDANNFSTADVPIPTTAVLEIVKSSSYRKLLLLSISFLLLFMGFFAAQNFQTTMPSGNGDGAKVGATALAILYAVFMMSTFVSTNVVQKVGLKRSLIFASLGYVLFCAYNLYPTPTFAYIAAAFDGFCSATLWTAQGAFATMCISEYNLINGGSPSGLFNGTFFSFFQSAQFLGNLLVALLFQAKVANSTVFLVLTLVCFSGTLFMFFIQEPQLEDKSDAGMQFGQKGFDWSNFKMFKDRKFQLMVAIIFFSGIECGFLFGALPALVPDILLRFYVLAVMGISDMLASLSLGTLSDRIGRIPVLMIGLTSGTIAFIVVMACSSSPTTGLYFAVAILLGISDAVMNTQPYAILGLYFEENPTPAFANFRLLQSFGITVSFIYFPFVTFTGQALINLVFLWFGVLSVLYLHKFIQNVNHY
eukprot:TRINITY_DN9746_c0_g1_i1.p1 TRINITY_DN9746_c0_g1~~TRINITY_DN9746_c0_g1_i1.p1  ORF type:complete len:440 (-),score=126.85 TRINITY_DN9746_c0_g1_i1:27-1346(-)